MAAQAVRQLMTGEIYVVGATAKYYAKAVEDDKDYVEGGKGKWRRKTTTTTLMRCQWTT
jgi:hypothetical protein